MHAGPSVLTCLTEIDAAAFAWVNAGASPLLDQIMPLATLLGQTLVAGGVVLGLVLFVRRTWERRAAAAGIAILALTFTGLCNTSLKYVVARSRPLTYFKRVAATTGGCAGALAPDASFRVRVLGERLTKRSFPSGHTQTAFAAATVLVGLFGLRYVPAFLVALLVGYSRIYIGAHFPGDVLAGALVGTCGSLAVLQVVRRLGPGLDPADGAPHSSKWTVPGPEALRQRRG